MYIRNDLAVPLFEVNRAAVALCSNAVVGAAPSLRERSPWVRLSAGRRTAARAGGNVLQREKRKAAGAAPHLLGYQHALVAFCIHKKEVGMAPLGLVLSHALTNPETRQASCSKEALSGSEPLQMPKNPL